MSLLDLSGLSPESETVVYWFAGRLTNNNQGIRDLQKTARKLTDGQLLTLYNTIENMVAVINEEFDERSA